MKIRLNSFSVRLLFSCVIGRVACIILILSNPDPFIALLLEIPEEKSVNKLSYILLDITTYGATLFSRGRFFFIILLIPFAGILC